MWDAEQIDALTEVVVQRLLVEGGTARGLAVEIATRLAAERPDLPALAVALPFSLAAGGIEDMLGGGQQACAAAFDAWRVAALIGGDTLALQAGLARAPTVADLCAHWADNDTVFNA
ncbi:MAG: hypothetical protein KDK01_05885 [Rhodobacteraceae bacterium]|nr:hypothetical protein [Paracoccaceae bacterium]